MKRKLIIDGNAVYEIDEDCMLKRKISEKEIQRNQRKQCEDDPPKNEKWYLNDFAVCMEMKNSPMQDMHRGVFREGKLESTSSAAAKEQDDPQTGIVSAEIVAASASATVASAAKTTAAA